MTSETITESAQWRVYALAGDGLFLRSKLTGGEVYLVPLAAATFRESLNAIVDEDLQGAQRDRVFNILCAEVFSASQE